MKSLLVSEPEKDHRARPGSMIPIDAPVDLPRAHPVATLGPGDLFGEMTCLNFYPRSATVRALEETVVLEMLRPVLEVLLRSKTFRAQTDDAYRARALETHLRSIPLFVDLSPEFIGRL